MKKNARLLSVVVALIFGAGVYHSIEASVNRVETLRVLQDDKTKIKKEELPEAARKALEGDAFKGWVISTTYKLKSGEYEVELKKGAEIQTVKFGKDGKVK